MEQAAVEVFISYAPEDEALLKELEKHLSLLVRQGAINGWHRGRIRAGEERSQRVAEQLDRARVIVLLISADFHASHAYEEELTRALARHRAGEARLIPVIGESPKVRVIGERLEEAYRRRDALRKADGAKAKTAEIDAEILELRRRLREGGQLRAGDVLGGRYLLLERIGRGGFAVVWRAQDREAEGEGEESDVAIKVLHPNLAGDPVPCRDGVHPGRHVHGGLGYRR